jgi:hypothetical protein
MAFWNSPSGTSASGADLVTNGGWAALATPIEGLPAVPVVSRAESGKAERRRGRVHAPHAKTSRPSPGRTWDYYDSVNATGGRTRHARSLPETTGISFIDIG